MKKLHILLVEDDDSHALLARHTLDRSESVGTVAHVSSGEDAIDYLEQSGQYADADRPDFVLLDLKMPLVNGFDVLDYVREKPKLKTIPIVILSTSAHPNDVEQAYGLGARNYLVKPMKLTDLDALIENLQAHWDRLHA